jgi:hypothetical protein
MRAETLDQKIEWYGISAPLSNSSGRPFYEEIGMNERPEAPCISFLLKMWDHLNRIKPA